MIASKVNKSVLKDLDIKFPILLGDQFHSKAYFMTSRIGNNEVTNILSTIEENFSKSFFKFEVKQIGSGN